MLRIGRMRQISDFNTGGKEPHDFFQLTGFQFLHIRIKQAVDACNSFFCTWADPGFGSGGPAEFWPQGVPWAQNLLKIGVFSLRIAWKLHDFDLMLGAGGGPGPLDPLVSTHLHVLPSPPARKEGNSISDKAVPPTMVSCSFLGLPPPPPPPTKSLICTWSEGEISHSLKEIYNVHILVVCSKTEPSAPFVATKLFSSVEALSEGDITTSGGGNHSSLINPHPMSVW